ncbi:lipid A deacylase LpxR family protein [Spirosoma aerolatum]|uniref:lipid A deacylase LpxR family protein n=1 Tax=Spirosoma aerolatum TaxID=1211326 RepID=UPI0014742DEF|nr:lipid A deacylase LpxR family protein [Spirosoma aerolatum]
MARQLRLFFLIFCAGTCFGQQHPYELNVSSENDNYCLNLHDGYYTNGLFVTLNYAPVGLNNRIRETSRLSKIVGQYQAGQMIFTPEFVTPKTTKDLMDRPFAGYLYAQKGLTFFYKKGHVLKTSVSVGTIGENSLAEQTQIFIHKTFDLLHPKGWNYQIHNEVGVNLQGQYWHELLPACWRKSRFDLHSLSQLTVGNTFTNASAGLLFRAGRFTQPDQSSWFNARVGREASHTSTEFYMFVQPAFQYQLYNATVQGGYFTNDAGAILSPLRHWGYRYDIGLLFSPPRWTFQIMYTYKQREAATMRHNEQFGGLTMAYRFGK